MPSYYVPFNKNYVTVSRKQPELLEEDGARENSGIDSIIENETIKNKNINEFMRYCADYQVPKYLKEFLENREDFIQSLLKFLIIEPTSSMGSVLAYTWLGDPRMVRTDDVIPGTDLAFELDAHEGGHTEMEYETRIRSRWKMEKPDLRYKK